MNNGYCFAVAIVKGVECFKISDSTHKITGSLIVMLKMRDSRMCFSFVLSTTDIVDLIVNILTLAKSL